MLILVRHVELRGKYIKDIEMLEILTGLEIDSVKSGIKLELSEYLEVNKAGRSNFLKYKRLSGFPNCLIIK